MSKRTTLAAVVLGINLALFLPILAFVAHAESTPTPTTTITATATATLEPTFTASPSPTPTSTATATVTSTVTPSPTATDVPTIQPTATATGAPPSYTATPFPWGAIVVPTPEGNRKANHGWFVSWVARFAEFVEDVRHGLIVSIFARSDLGKDHEQKKVHGDNIPAPSPTSAATSTPWPTATPTVSMAGGRYENEALQYSVGWQRYPATGTIAGPSGGTVHYSETTGAWASLSFVGNRVSYLYTQSSARGKARVQVLNSAGADVVPPQVVDLNGDLVWQKALTINLPGATEYKLVVTVTGDTSGAHRVVDVDAVVVETVGPTSTATVAPTSTPTATTTPNPTATATTTPNPTATATPNPTATGTTVPTATATMEATPTATSTTLGASSRFEERERHQDNKGSRFEERERLQNDEGSQDGYQEQRPTTVGPGAGSPADQRGPKEAKKLGEEPGDDQLQAPTPEPTQPTGRPGRSQSTPPGRAR